MDNTGKYAIYVMEIIVKNVMYALAITLGYALYVVGTFLNTVRNVMGQVL